MTAAVAWLLEVVDGFGAAASNPPVALLAIATLSLTLLASVCNHRALRQRGHRDDAAFIGYFGWFFALCFLAPLVYVLAVGRTAGLTLPAIGLGPGNWRLGLALSAIAAPLAVLAAWSGSRDPAMQSFYPLSRVAAGGSTRLLAWYEAAYVGLYYTAWELVFRGVMLFAVLALLPPGPSSIAVALLVQTLVSTVFHLGHPATEVVAALPTGLVFGAIALATGSIYYVVFIHSVVGVTSDLFNRRRWLAAGARR